MIGIIDYGLGNIRAFSNIYDQLNIPARLIKEVGDFEGVSRIILPGVGAFDHAMELLAASGLRPKLEEIVLQRKAPVLGICVGMQILANDSDEGKLPGLGWVGGTVRKMTSMPVRGGGLPHMGWNRIEPNAGHPLFAGLDHEFGFYFLHSYFFDSTSCENVIATAHYGDRFACSVSNGNIFGVQFHPEKSHHNGVQLLRNFAENIQC